MKRLFAALLPLSAFPALGQSGAAPRADWFTANGAACVYAAGTPGTYAAAYSAPGGGRELQHAEIGAGGIVRWPAVGAALPAFVLCRDGGTGASVWPLGEAQFAVTGPVLERAGSTSRLRWNCGPRAGERLTVEVWRSTGGGAYQRLAAAPAAGAGQWDDADRTGTPDAYRLRVVTAAGVVAWEAEAGSGTGAGAATLYPNPAAAAATLCLPGGTAAWTATVLDGQGRTVRTLAVRGETTPVPLVDLAPGTYTVRVCDASGVSCALPLVKR